VASGTAQQASFVSLSSKQHGHRWQVPASNGQALRGCTGALPVFWIEGPLVGTARVEPRNKERLIALSANGAANRWRASD
jgi:hypothetical protein